MNHFKKNKIINFCIISIIFSSININISYAKKEVETISTSIKKESNINTSHKAIILAYHGISDKKTSMNISFSNFKSQIDYLNKNGYTIIGLPELIDSINNKKLLPSKAIILTFDDGWKNQNQAMAYLSIKNQPATFGLVTNFQKINSKTTLQDVDFKEYKKSPFIYVNHSSSHRPQDYLMQPNKDVPKSKKELLELFTTFYPYYIYPYGLKNKKLIDELKINGYKAGLGVDEGIVDINNKSIDMYNLPRYLINETTNIDKFKMILKQLN